jgi:hypothetical protein
MAINSSQGDIQWRWPVRDVGRYLPLRLPGQELFAAIYPARSRLRSLQWFTCALAQTTGLYSLLDGPSQAPSSPAVTPADCLLQRRAAAAVAAGIPLAADRPVVRLA